MEQQLLDLKSGTRKYIISSPQEYLGLFVGTGDEIRELELNFEHNLPNSKSLVMVKAILFDKAQFHFTGNLEINTGARDTDTYLRVDVLMLSPRARATAVPALEIKETSVKGGHGATVGKLDPNQMFYLQSKGLSLPQAENLLAHGFAREVVERAQGEIKQKLERELAKLELETD